MKKVCLKTTGLAAVLLMTGCGQAQIEPIHPNIVIIMTDDQGWGDLSIHGNKNLHTPNIDYLAKNGAQFQNFYVSSVCAPTRSELLTGRYHPRSGVSGTSEGGERMNLDETTLADLFKEAGYKTATFGKWHNGTQYPYHPNGRGFDEFYGFCSGHWGDYFSPMLEHNGKIIRGEGYLPDDITSRAINFMEQNKNNPFLLYIAQITPHSPMQVPDDWYDKFQDKELEMLADEHYRENSDFTRVVLAMIENIDWNVGRVTDKLNELKLLENTIILFLSDNGPNSYRWNGGMKGRKGSLDEGGLRSPLFIQWSGHIEPGKEIKEIAHVIDLLPTLADLAGIEYITAHPLDGVSLEPLLLNKISSWNDRLLFSHHRPRDGVSRVSVRSQNYRLDNEGKLFNITKDPGQHLDISSREPQTRDELMAALENWRSTVLSNLGEEMRPFTVGHPEARYTYLPARDGQARGNILRSNISPNSSFYTNWTSPDDQISWYVDILSEGYFEATIFYTCPPEDIGASFKLSFGTSSISGKISQAHDPPLQGMENDRIKRTESYIKDFKPLHLGEIYLNKGIGNLMIQATDIPGSQLMDFRLLMLKKTSN